MKKLICTLAVMSMVVGACNLAQAEFLGWLHRGRDWNFNVDNSETGGWTAVTVHYVGKGDKVETRTVDPFNPRVQLPFSRPGKGTTRILIDVDAPKGGLVRVEVEDGVQSVPEMVLGHGRMVFDVVE